jgi:hypothetical protein
MRTEGTASRRDHRKVFRRDLKGDAGGIEALETGWNGLRGRGENRGAGGTRDESRGEGEENAGEKLE